MRSIGRPDEFPILRMGLAYRTYTCKLREDRKARPARPSLSSSLILVLEIVCIGLSDLNQGRLSDKIGLRVESVRYLLVSH